MYNDEQEASWEIATPRELLKLRKSKIFLHCQGRYFNNHIVYNKIKTKYKKEMPLVNYIFIIEKCAF